MAAVRRDDRAVEVVVAGLDPRAKRPVSAAVAGPYGHPFHPILVTVPIGAWVSSLVLDVGSRVASDGAPLATGARWLVAIGVVGAIGAAVAGLLDFLLIPPGTRAHRTAVVHMSLNLAITAAYVVGFLWRSSGDDAGTATGPFVLSVACLAALAVSGSLGGALSYRYGVRVAEEADQLRGFTTADVRSTGRRGG
jgi:uncharacterized membrane protein